MIGVVLSNADASMAPSGGVERFFGTNPIAVGVPSGQTFPVVLDMATSVVAVGRILLAAATGQGIPLGWAVDSVGRPTTDPVAALRGAVLPAAGHKGSGLAFMIEVMIALVGGGPFGPHVPSSAVPSSSQRLGHFLIAIDVSRYVETEAFTKRVDALVDELHRVTPANGVSRVLAPGEIEGHTQSKHLLTGIPLAPATFRSLRALGPIETALRA